MVHGKMTRARVRAAVAGVERRHTQGIGLLAQRGGNNALFVEGVYTAQCCTEVGLLWPGVWFSGKEGTLGPGG